MAEVEADPLFTQEIVKDFMLSHDGKVSNNILVNHFKNFLNDPQRKTANRQRFKCYVNTLSSIKLDTSGEKLLILKKKFRDSGAQEWSGGGTSVQSSLPAKGEPSSISSSKTKTESETNLEEELKTERPNDKQKSTEDLGSPSASAEIEGDKTESDKMDCPFVSPVRTEVQQLESQDVVLRNKGDKIQMVAAEKDSKMSPVDSSSDATEVLKGLETSSGKSSSHSCPTEGTDVKDSKPGKVMNTCVTPNLNTSEASSVGMSVKDAARNINKLESDAGVVPRTNKTKRESRMAGKSTSNDSGDFDMTLNEIDREWIVKSAYSDYHAMVKMLQTHSYLARKRDFITGYTALHWACKNGQMDVVKLLCGTHSADANIRTQGGYTPLHLAALHNHEDIVEQLIRVYGADPNLRDYGGKTAKHYLSPSASSRSHQLLQPRRVGSAINSSSSTATQALAKGVFTNLLTPAGAGKENTSPCQSPVSTKPFRHEDYSSLMPPPRELPPVARRKPTSREKTSSHSDSETQDEVSEGIIHASGSSPDFGTIV